MKIVTATLLLAGLSFSALARDGTDQESCTDITVESGNLVRSGNSQIFSMRKLTATICLILTVFMIGPANAQMYEKDGMQLNSAGGNIFGDSSINPMADPDINPMADPDINPMADPDINPMADPDINPMADPDINPMGDAYIRDDGTMGLKSEDLQ